MTTIKHIIANASDMDLPEGKTCADCVHVEKCVTMFGAKAENKYCGFEPIRFKAK